MVATAPVLDRTDQIATHPSMDRIFDKPRYNVVVIAPQPKAKPAEEIILLAEVMPRPVIKLTWSKAIWLIRWLLPVYAFAMLLLAYDMLPLLSYDVLAQIELPVALVSTALFTVLAFRPQPLIGRKTYQ